MLQYRTNAGERRKPALGLYGELTVYPAPEQNQTAGSSQSGQQPRPYARHRTAPGQTLQLSARLSPSSEVFHYRKVMGSSLARQVHLIKVKTCSLSV